MNILKYSTLWNTEFGSKDKAEELINLIKEDDLDKSKGWEFRLISNYMAIVCNSKNVSKDSILDLYLSIKIILKVKYDVDTLKKMKYAMFIKFTKQYNGFNCEGVKFLEKHCKFTMKVANIHITYCDNYNKAFLMVEGKAISMHYASPYDNEFKYDIDDKLMILCDRYDYKTKDHISKYSEIIFNRIRILASSNLLQNKLEFFRTITNTLNLTYEQVKILIKYDAYTISESIKGININRLVFEISKMNSVKQAYYLGFPIQYGIPGKKFISESLKKLSEIGSDKYVEDIRDKFKGLKFTEFKHNEEHLYNTYFPFDRFEFIDGDIFYKFIRGKKPKILRSSIIGNEDFQSREYISNKFEIPKAEPMILLYHKIEKPNEITPLKNYRLN